MSAHQSQLTTLQDHSCDLEGLHHLCSKTLQHICAQSVWNWSTAEWLLHLCRSLGTCAAIQHANAKSVEYDLGIAVITKCSTNIRIHIVAISPLFTNYFNIHELFQYSWTTISLTALTTDLQSTAVQGFAVSLLKSIYGSQRLWLCNMCLLSNYVGIKILQNPVCIYI